MSIKDQIQIEPVRSLAALHVLGSAIITGLAFKFHYSGDAVGLLSAGWTAFIAFLSTFVRANVTSNPAVMDKVHDTIVALAPFAPVVTDVTVPVAASPLINPPTPIDGS